MQDGDASFSIVVIGCHHSIIALLFFFASEVMPCCPLPILTSLEVLSKPVLRFVVDDGPKCELHGRFQATGCGVRT